MPSLYIEEKRVAPRLNCHLDVLCDGFVIGSAENVSIGGMRISTTSELLINHTYQFVLNPYGSKRKVVLVGRVLNREGEQYGVAIEKIDKKSKDLYNKFVVSLRESCQLLDIVGELKKSSETLALTSADSILEIFKKCADNKYLFKIAHPDAYQPFTAVLESFDGGHIQFRLRSKQALGMSRARVLYSVVMVQYHSFYFEMTSVSMRGGLLSCHLPSIIWFSDRRKEERRLFQDSEVKVSIRGPMDRQIEGSLMDYSSNGARVRLSRQSGIVFLRTPIDHVEIDQFPGIKKAIVRSVRSVKDDCQDLGLQFVDEIKHEDYTVNPVSNFRRGGVFARYLHKVFDVGNALISKVAAAKASPDEQDPCCRVVSFPNAQGHVVSGLLDSAQSLRGKIKCPLVVIIPAWATKKDGR